MTTFTELARAIVFECSYQTWKRSAHDASVKATFNDKDARGWMAKVCGWR